MSAFAKSRSLKERRLLIEAISISDMDHLRQKSRTFAAIAGARCSSEDLVQASLLAALEGKPPWRTTQSLSQYCACVMASRVGA